MGPEGRRLHEQVHEVGCAICNVSHNCEQEKPENRIDSYRCSRGRKVQPKGYRYNHNEEQVVEETARLPIADCLRGVVSKCRSIHRPRSIHDSARRCKPNWRKIPIALIDDQKDQPGWYSSSTFKQLASLIARTGSR